MARILSKIGMIRGGILIEILAFSRNIKGRDSHSRIIHEPRLPQMQGAGLSKDRFA
jgi:hypothetical protein